jgi:exodeoxyribonuclease-1|nr:exonuclease domain-containing protein [Neorhizobium tomejilense]
MIEFTFYDNEATGVSVRHDQVTQFAGITCDASFRIKNSISKFIRLLPYVVPHPQALSVTRKRAEDIANPRLVSEYAAAKEVAAFLTPPRGVTRVFVTYNGIKYDDEILRTMLFRNLENPYFNTGRDCIKIDLFTVLRFVQAVDPDAIVVPVDADGKSTFRLENVCPANGIEIEAHDAYHDSVATMHLFALVQEKAPWAIELAMECGNAQKMESMLTAAAISGEPLFRFTSFGKPDFAPLAITASDGAKKHLGIDLRIDGYPAEFGRIAEQLYKPDTPFQVVTSNKFPLLLSAEKMHGLTKRDLPESLLQRALEINRNSELKAACKDAVSLNTIEKVNAPTSEELIYGGFPDSGEKQKMSAFNTARTWLEKAQVRFSDARMRDFSARIVLEAVGTGEAALPACVIRGLALDCAEALCRPFAGPEARHTTIASCIEDGADDDWIDWARGRYGDHPVFDMVPVAMQAAPPQGQLSFGF